MDEPEEEGPAKIQRRKHLRLTALGLVELVLQGGNPQGAYLASIGRGGLGIYLHQKIESNQLVVLNLELIEEGKKGRVLKIAARVRWASPVGRLYMAGLAFEQMSDERYKILLKHFRVMEDFQLLR